MSQNNRGCSPQEYFEKSEESQKTFADRANKLKLNAMPIIQQQISKVLAGGGVGPGVCLRIVEASRRKKVGRRSIELRDLAENEANARKLREELVSGTYKPQRVRRVVIPKTGGRN